MEKIFSLNKWENDNQQIYKFLKGLARTSISGKGSVNYIIICELQIAFLQRFSCKRIQVGPGVPCWSMHQLNLPMTKSNFMSLQSKCRLQLNKFITKTKLVTDEQSPTPFLTLNHGCASASFAVIRSSWFGSSIIFIRSFACSETPSHCLGRIWIEVGILTSHWQKTQSASKWYRKSLTY